MTHWTGKRVLVTGAGGFIGSHLAERLASEGAKVRAFVHYRGDGSTGLLAEPWVKGMEVHAGDVRDRECIRRAVEGCDVVFHLAALIGIPYSYVAPSSYVETNVTGTQNVLQAARDLGTERVVVTSTSEVYGTAVMVPMDENHPINPQSPYAASKVAADALAASYHRSFDLPVVTVRPFNTFGPRQSMRAVIPTIIAQLLTAPERLQLGNLEATRDFNYVDDTVDGFLAAGKAADGVNGMVLNVGSGREISIGHLADRIGRMMPECGGRPFIAVESHGKRLRPAGSEVERLCCNPTRIHELLGWEPRVGLAEGLRRTIGWMRENAGRYRANEYAV